MSPYVGMARKQNGGYNTSISVQTLIFHLVVNSTRLKTVRSALWRCPNSTVALRLLENVVKVTNQEVVKIDFRHLPFLLLSLFLLLQPAWRLNASSAQDKTPTNSREILPQTYILDSGARRIALLPAHLHGGSPTCCCGSGSLQVGRGS